MLTGNYILTLLLNGLQYFGDDRKHAIHLSIYTELARILLLRLSFWFMFSRRRHERQWKSVDFKIYVKFDSLYLNNKETEFNSVNNVY